MFYSDVTVFARLSTVLHLRESPRLENGDFGENDVHINVNSNYIVSHEELSLFMIKNKQFPVAFMWT